MFFKRCIVVVCVALTGCAGQLHVYDADQKEVKGVPFRIAEVYVKKGIYTKHTKGGNCSLTPFVETLSLPSGAQYFVAAQSAQFAKTGFNIKFADNGAVAEISLDSEPSGSETLKATSELLKTVAPMIGVGAVVATAQTKPAANDSVAQALPNEKACDSGEDQVNFIKFNEYLKQPS